MSSRAMPFIWHRKTGSKSGKQAHLLNLEPAAHCAAGFLFGYLSASLTDIKE